MKLKMMQLGKLKLALIFLTLTGFSLSIAQESSDYLSMQVPLSPPQAIEASVEKQQARINAGQSFSLAVDLTYPEGLRTGWIIPLGDWPATQLHLILPKPLEIRQIQWPIPKVDLSVLPPQVYYQGKITALVDVFWKSTEEKVKPMPSTQAELLVRGQARWSNETHFYELSRLAVLPALFLPNEIPTPEDPFTQSRYAQIKEHLPQRVDPADVDWQIGKGWLEIRGKNLRNDLKWVAIAYRQRSFLQDEKATAAIIVRHQKKEDKDLFDVPMKTIEEWKQAQVEEILLIDEHSHQAWIISLVGDETINYSLMQQLSSWCQKVFMQFSTRRV